MDDRGRNGKTKLAAFGREVVHGRNHNASVSRARKLQSTAKAVGRLESNAEPMFMIWRATSFHRVLAPATRLPR